MKSPQTVNTSKGPKQAAYAQGNTPKAQKPAVASTENAPKEQKPVFAFTRINYILLAVGMAIVILGFYLMSGEGSGETTYNPAIFDAQHIKVAPIVALAGYVFILFAILFRKKGK